MTSLLVALAVAAAPLAPGDLDAAAGQFLGRHAGARVVAAPHGGLEHASGLATARAAPDDEENARRFLAREGGPFGVAPGEVLQSRRVRGLPGEGGVAVFRRTFDGLPVFAGEIAVGWRADGAITVVNGSRALAVAPAGPFAVGPEDARAAALSAAPGVPGESSVEQGWLQFEGALLPAFRVVHSAAEPLDSFVSYVDGESGQLLYRLSRRRSACATASCPTPPCVCSFLLSPLAPAPPPDATTGNDPALFTVADLAAPAPGAKLTGSRTTVYDCLGARGTAGDVNHFAACRAQLATADASGSFSAEPDPTQRDPADAFAEQSAYFHIDSHSRYLDGLDPAFAAGSPAGGIGFVSGYVNVLDDRGLPYENAFYSPTGGPAGAPSPRVMVYGQGARVDLAYDAEVVYHELTHGAVDVTASFEELTDRFGVDVDPGALNEGTADTFAFAHVADALAGAGLPVDSASCLSRYLGAAAGEACLRQAANARTCRGDGPNDGRNPGRVGEIHDDGEIWSGFTWPLLRAAYDQGVGGAMASALFRALEAVGPHASFVAYAETVRQKAADQPGLGAAAADFVACTIAQRDVAGCGDGTSTARTVALYSGERAEGFFFGITGQASASTAAAQQYFIDVPCGATALHVQTGDASLHGGLYVRYGRPVEFGAPGLGAPAYDWAASGNQADLVLSTTGCSGCSACVGAQTPFGAGRWYFLPFGPAGDQGGNVNAFTLGLSLELPAGATAPQRVRRTIGAPPTDPAAPVTDANVCVWGRGPEPLNPLPTIPVTPPLPAECAPPVPPARSPPCSTTAGGATQSSGGCGCRSLGDPAEAALALSGLLAWRQRRRLRRPAAP